MNRNNSNRVNIVCFTEELNQDVRMTRNQPNEAKKHGAKHRKQNL